MHSSCFWDLNLPRLCLVHKALEPSDGSYHAMCKKPARAPARRRFRCRRLVAAGEATPSPARRCCPADRVMAARIGTAMWQLSAWVREACACVRKKAVSAGTPQQLIYPRGRKVDLESSILEARCGSACGQHWAALVVGRCCYFATIPSGARASTRMATFRDRTEEASVYANGKFRHS